jgi:hypothetical protein
MKKKDGFLYILSHPDRIFSSYGLKDESKATYDVYYWRNVSDGNVADERLIGSVTGLANCRNMALSHASVINERWSERSYICMLKKDGRNLEKHRL